LYYFIILLCTIFDFGDCSVDICLLYCIVFIFVCLCVMCFFLTSFMSNCCMTEFVDLPNGMYVRMYVYGQRKVICTGFWWLNLDEPYVGNETWPCCQVLEERQNKLCPSWHCMWAVVLRQWKLCYQWLHLKVAVMSFVGGGLQCIEALL
jgi:hypothetical protein